jgi:putative transcriptional regulator
MDMRAIVLTRLVPLLQREGFSVTSFMHCNSCFDLVAEKQGLKLLIKVLGNIDALRRESADELKKLSHYFNAVPLIIGSHSKAFQLQNGVVYDRFDLDAVSLRTFKSMLDEEMPSVRYFKGRTSVELDADKLREKRKEKDFSMSDLANKVGVTKESMHRYEKGVNASLEVARKLERIFHCHLIKELNLFEKELDYLFEERTSFDETFERLRKLGMKLTLFNHAPFKAADKLDEDLLIDRGTKQDFKKKAMLLEKSKKAFNSHGVILTKKSRLKVIQSTPIVEEEELASLNKPRDLLKLVKEREIGEKTN